MRVITRGGNQRTIEELDERGNVTRRTLPDGAIERFVFDPLTNRKTRYTDTLGVVTSYEYDSLGNLAKTIEAVDTALERTTTSEYFPNSTLLKLRTEPSGRQTAYEYDHLARLTRTYDPANAAAQTRYTYEAGRLATRTDAAGRTTRYAYNAAGQPTAIDYPTMADVTFTYDQQGRRLRMDDASGTTTWTYDAAGRPVAETQSRAGRQLTSTYDAASLRTSLTISASEISDPAISNLPSWTTTYAYDAAARLHAVLDPRVSAKPFLYTYDARASVVAQLAMPTGQTIAYARDAQGRLLSTTLSGTARQTLATHAYTYDLAGQRTTASTASATTAYTYDALRQLATATETPAGTGQTPTRQFAYAYDPIGNRLTAATATETTTYTANSVNQYTAIVSQISNSQISDTPAYDANGNTTTLPSGLVLDYDEENRLVSAATLTAREEYTYDGLGRRVERRIFTASSGLTAPAATTRYVYDGWRVLEELTSTQSSPFTLHASYTRGLDLSGTLEGAGGIGGLLAMTRDPAGSATSAYYFHDGNGNVSTLVSASDALLASYNYTPFGDTLTATGTWASVNAYRFSAKESDAFTGLYYYGLRYYSPSTGRWVKRDPIEEVDGPNMYSFVANDPSNYLDVLGLARSGYRPLGDGKAPIVTEPEGSIADRCNFEVNHEHFFFDDGKDLFGNPVPANLANVGYGPVGNLPKYPDSGAFSEDTSGRNYRFLDDYYDDDLLRKAIINVLNSGEWRADKYELIWDFDKIPKRNCQDFATAVRREYERLRSAIELQRQMEAALERLLNNGRTIPAFRRRY